LPIAVVRLPPPLLALLQAFLLLAQPPPSLLLVLLVVALFAEETRRALQVESPAESSAPITPQGHRPHAHASYAAAQGQRCHQL
jgi:hypothetical protein